MTPSLTPCSTGAELPHSLQPLRSGDVLEPWPADAPVIRLLGMPIHPITLTQCVVHILGSLARGCGGWVVTPNIDILRRWHRDEAFRELISGATLCVADGVPLVWAARVANTPLAGRVNGTDLMMSLSEAAADQDQSIYLLGGQSGTAELAGEALLRRWPRLRIAGYYCPPMGFENDADELQRIAEELEAARPDIIFVGLGCPKQERLIARLRPMLPHAWWLGIGISFSLIGGAIPRAPRWMQAGGLEWLHRLLQEPQRLLQRYLVHGVPFALRLFLWCISARIRGKRQEEVVVHSPGEGA